MARALRRKSSSWQRLLSGPRFLGISQANLNFRNWPLAAVSPRSSQTTPIEGTADQIWF
jgi:hypothetical protein